MDTGGFVATGGGRVERGGGGIGAPLSRFAGEAVTKARSFKIDGLAGVIGEIGVGVASCDALRFLNLSGFGPGETFRD